MSVVTLAVTDDAIEKCYQVMAELRPACATAGIPTASQETGGNSKLPARLFN
jgi:hypothetical protein